MIQQHNNTVQLLDLFCQAKVILILRYHCHLGYTEHAKIWSAQLSHEPNVINRRSKSAQNLVVVKMPCSAQTQKKNTKTNDEAMFALTKFTIHKSIESTIYYRSI